MDSLPSVKVKMGSLPSGEQCIAMMGPGDLLSSNFPEGINGERQVLKSCHWRKRNLIRSHHGKKNQINWLSLSFWGWRKTPLLYVNVTCVYIPVELQLKDKRLCWITATRKSWYSSHAYTWSSVWSCLFKDSINCKNIPDNKLKVMQKFAVRIFLKVNWTITKRKASWIIKKES